VMLSLIVSRSAVVSVVMEPESAQTRIRS